MNRIKELPKASSQLLSSTQIISSVHSAVKELIENALDSLATNIEIKLEDFGLAKIEVKDNGKGIHKDDISFVAKPHCTSKITSHLDLNTIESYGFRGEGLAALCSVSELVITTKTIDESFGFTYTFDHNGNVLSTKPCPCNQGTSVVCSNLFKNIPVRKQFYRSDKNKKEELKKVEDILISFGCIQTGVRFTLVHDRNMIWQKPSVNKVREGLVQIFGNAIVDHMENCEFKDDDTQINIDVFLPNQNAPLTCSHSSVNRSIVAINKRPVRMKVLDKLLKEYYNKALTAGNKSRYPICYIAIEMPPSSIDVNFEPNKTAVAMENSNIIVDQLSKILSTFYFLNPETDTSKNIPNISLTLPPPQIPTDDTPKILNEVRKQAAAPTFQMKLSQLSPVFTKPSITSKLSRKRDQDTPSNKRKRTSSFSTPPNDIHRHINTLNSFFTSEKNTDCTSTLNVEELSTVNKPEFVLPTEKVIAATAQRTESNGISVSNMEFSLVQDKRKNSNGTSVLNGQCESITAQRAPLINVPTLDIQSKSIFVHKQPSESTLLNSLCNVTAVERDNLSNISTLDMQCNAVSVQKPQPGQLTPLNDQCPEVTVQRENLNEISVKSVHFGLNKVLANKPESYNQDKVINDLEICSKNKLVFDINENNTLNLDEVTNNSKESNPVNKNEWSRGLHPVVSIIQPVAVLKPKVVGKHQDKVRPAMGIENLEDKNEYNEISTIQRKCTPFDYFCRKHRLEVASLNPDFNNHQIAQILTKKWSCLSNEEKGVYKDVASEDSPNNIPNKENLDKDNKRGLNKSKDKSRSCKKAVRKMKKKNKESSIVFNMEIIKKNLPFNYSLEDEIEEDLNIISCLVPGVWICCQDHKLYLLNCFRLQEAIVFQRLLETYQLEPEPLESSFILTSDSLGDDAMNVLSQMNSTIDYRNQCVITDENLIANGFKIRLLKGENENHFEVVGITQSIAFYGIPDLKEILQIIHQKGSVEIMHCRPKNVIQYLQGEAIRIARQYPASKSLEDTAELLEKLKFLSSSVCIHSLPILHELFAINTE